MLERRVGGRAAFAGVFPELPAGAYSLWRDVMTDEQHRHRGRILVEIDWRHITDPSDFRLSLPEPRPGCHLVTGGGTGRRPSRASGPLSSGNAGQRGPNGRGIDPIHGGRRSSVGRDVDTILRSRLPAAPDTETPCLSLPRRTKCANSQSICAR